MKTNKINAYIFKYCKVMIGIDLALEKEKFNIWIIHFASLFCLYCIRTWWNPINVTLTSCGPYSFTIHIQPLRCTSKWQESNEKCQQDLENSIIPRSHQPVVRNELDLEASRGTLWIWKCTLIEDLMLGTASAFSQRCLHSYISEAISCSNFPKEIMF